MTSLHQLKRQTTPFEFSNFIHQQGDISFWEKGNFWLIANYNIAKQALKEPALSADRGSYFVSRMPELNLNLVSDFFSVVSQMMVMSDDDDHQSKRRLCFQGLSNNILASLEEKIHHFIHARLDEYETKNSFDFVHHLAQPLPCFVLAELFAIAPSERDDFYQWSYTMTNFFGGASDYQDSDGIKVNHAAKQLRAFFHDLIEQKRQQNKQDFLSILIHHQPHFGLSDDQLVAQCIMMLVAGTVTTGDQLTQNLHLLVNTPSAIQTMQKDTTTIPAYIEEASRLDPAVNFIFRVARESCQLGDKQIKAGDVIFISTHAANRCPSAFNNPNDIDIDHPQNKHLAYGQGSHFCLGAKLARREMQAVFSILLERYPYFEILDAKRSHPSLAFSGFEHLRIQLNAKQKCAA